ncbi:hypothetical protein GPECTOR_92g611 [Gonium pectorale]|uniref:Diphthine--ammonia ligase n=1 Tax=Gonium pectorale TaxID=33097 RepID=A0A150G0M5_GONPE|nr:hypothetical protein GPECTOR_92g611 [Gonium pectorale]|eukprot:KXZ43388.1 hypothetical protein GPECTOR_92g611 [Gonium pectorale]
MTGAKRRAAISFTGGKDSCAVLHLMRASEVALRASEGWAEEAWRADLRERLAQVADCEAVLLVTFVPAGGTQPFKAHPLEVVKLQAQALGLPHVVLEVSPQPSFLDSYRANMAALRERHDVEVLATGDILDVFMPRAAAGSGLSLLSPLFGIPRRVLLELVWAYGMRPLITCVNVTKFAVQPKLAVADAAGAPTEATAAVAGEREAPGEVGPGEAQRGDGGDGGAASGGAESCAGQPVAPSMGDGAAAAPTTASTAAAAGSGCSGDSTEQPPPPPPLLGLVLDRAAHRDAVLPAVQAYGVDECGEWGEYHTMVLGSALFGGGGGELGLRLRTEARREGDYAYLAILSAELVAGTPPQPPSS